MGMAKDPVFPDPVSARPMTSRPSRAGGMEAAWIWVALSHFREAMEERREGWRFRLEKGVEVIIPSSVPWLDCSEVSSCTCSFGLFSSSMVGTSAAGRFRFFFITVLSGLVMIPHVRSTVFQFRHR